MRAERLSLAELKAAMSRMWERLDEAAGEVGRLDAQQGDGDLGVTCRAIAEAARKVLEVDHPDVGTLLTATADAIAEAAPSTFGTLLSAGLAEAGAAAAGWTEVDTESAAILLRSVVTAVQRLGKARPGDKTMLDALVPAAEALSRLAGDRDLTAGARAAAAAAEEGVERTRSMTPRVGRAAWLGERGLGVPDPGATAWAVMLRALAECPS